MEQQEHQILELLENWKVVGGIAVVIIIVLLLSFLLNELQGKKQPQVPQNKPVSQEVPTVIPEEKTVAAIDMNMSNTYRGDNFSLVYPASWHAISTQSYDSDVVTFANGGGDDPVPQFIVTTLNKVNASYSLLLGEDDFREKGHMESTIQVDGIKADKFTGEFPSPDDQKIYPDIPVQWETNIFFTKGNEEYTIRYRYLGDQKDPKYESMFSTILASLKLP